MEGKTVECKGVEAKGQEAKRRGVFVVIEGEDGTGKTTLAREVCEALTAKGIAALGTREPCGPMGQVIRTAARAGERLGSWEELAHFVMGRAEHWRDVIEPALQEGLVVVCDRWYYSTLVYNVPRIARKHGHESGQRARAMTLRAATPDLCVCLLLDEQERQRRIQARRLANPEMAQDAFDALASLRAKYEAACDGPECLLLDAHAPLRLQVVLDHIMDQR